MVHLSGIQEILNFYTHCYDIKTDCKNITNILDSAVEVSTWAQKYFRNLLAVKLSLQT